MLIDSSHCARTRPGVQQRLEPPGSHSSVEELLPADPKAATRPVTPATGRTGRFGFTVQRISLTSIPCSCRRPAACPSQHAPLFGQHGTLIVSRPTTKLSEIHQTHLRRVCLSKFYLTETKASGGAVRCFARIVMLRLSWLDGRDLMPGETSKGCSKAGGREEFYGSSSRGLETAVDLLHHAGRESPSQSLSDFACSSARFQAGASAVLPKSGLRIGKMP